MSGTFELDDDHGDPGLDGPTLVIRRGRGRTGGSTGLDLLIQRARGAGRRIKPLDGDLRSRTLSTLYPAVDKEGGIILDGASSPRSEEPSDLREWLLGELDFMVEERVSLALDLNGGDRAIQDFTRDLALAPYCREFGVRFLNAFFLGPDLEDLRHVLEVVRGGDYEEALTLLVLNEGAIRQGQSTIGAFEPILSHSDFKALLKDGARVVFLRRLTCMTVLRERGLSYSDVVAGALDKQGRRPAPTLRHMIKGWLHGFEDDNRAAGTVGWLP